jgi:nicotinic acid mononucleotide adenylyltransferase
MATSSGVTLVAAYPGTFDPPTIAHLAVAEAAWHACGVDRVELVLSLDPIGKDGATPIEERVAALEAAAATRPWLTVAVTDARLIADVAAGYDVVIMGADKWAQVLDPSFHPSEDEWRASLARLPQVAVARRGDLPVPGDVILLDVDLPDVSSTAVRQGRDEWRAT